MSRLVLAILVWSLAVTAWAKEPVLRGGFRTGNAQGDLLRK